MDKYCFGIDIGGTTVKMALFKEEGDIVGKWEIVTRTEDEGAAIIPDIIESLNAKITEYNLNREDILGIGVGIPAPVSEEGIVDGSANLGWKYKEPKRELEEAMNIPVLVANDANVAALGEMWQGGGKGYQNLVMITLGTGVGGGVINKGKIINGTNGAGGEIGHLVVNYNETVQCGCGNYGCLEQYSSATGIVRLANQRLEQDQESSVLRDEVVTAKAVFDAVKSGDKVACEIAEEFGRYLGYALANVAILMDPEVFVIGGGVSKAGTILLEYIEKYYQERAFFKNTEVKFVLATLGNDAGVCGAAKLVL